MILICLCIKNNDLGLTFCIIIDYLTNCGAYSLNDVLQKVINISSNLINTNSNINIPNFKQGINISSNKVNTKKNINTIFELFNT